jgi:outer membrane protein OmpA-like peptidoglycan-associated protein
MTASVRGPAASATAGLLLLLLGLADLVFLNLWVFPRTIRPRTQSWLSGGPVPLPELVASIHVDRAVEPAPPAPAIEIAPLQAAAPTTEPVAAEPPAAEPPTATPPAPARGPLRPVQVMFGYDDADIPPAAQEVLSAVAEHRGPGARLRIEGHADKIGPAAYNQWLSEQRANAVADRLAALGWRREQMLVQGFGDTRPASPGRDLVSRRQNRRVDVAVLHDSDGAGAPSEEPHVR